MSADKRTVATDALATLGMIIDASQKRDAIHLAVEPVIAGENLDPGHHIRVENGVAYRTAKGGGLGIVDPFLADFVKKGERFWFIMYPRMVNSLRHVWTHPEFPDEPYVRVVTTPAAPAKTEIMLLVESADAKAASEKWLRDFCKNNDAPSYDHLLVAVGGGTVNSDYGPCDNDGEYLTIMGSDAHCAIPDELWDHVEVVTGLKKLNRAKYFSCSC